MPTARSCLTIVTAALLLAACKRGSSDPADASVDTDSGHVMHSGCPRNWIPEHDYPPYPSLIHVVDGALVLEASSDGVEVQTPLGATGAADGVLRIDVAHLALGAGGHFFVSFLGHQISVADLEVTDTGAHLQMATTLGGLAYDLAFTNPPTHAVIELETSADGSVRVRANFFDAAGLQVLVGTLSEFNGGGLGTQMRLVGLSARAVIDRYSTYDPLYGAQADDFDCDSIGTPIDPWWPSTRYADLGTSCTTDAQCGATDRCSAGVCRRPCLTSTVCDLEVCLGDAEGNGFCRLPSERSCTSGMCPAGFVCGVDNTCRRPCTGGRAAYSTDFSDLAGTCPLNYRNCEFGGTCTELSDYRCVAGACTDDSEHGAKAAGGWGCGVGAVQCSGDNHDIEQCDVSGPGFQRIQVCGSFSNSCAYACPGPDSHMYSCPTGAPRAADAIPECATCRRTCERGEDVIDYCLGTTDNVAVDCETGFSWCSFGPGGDITRRQPGDLPYFQAECEAVVTPAPPPDKIAITPPTGSGVPPFHIDRTEVTRAQYVGFLQTRPLPHDPGGCGYNVTLLPGAVVERGDWPWFDHPNWPALVDWCDAFNYCEWAGGHLCGELGGGAVDSANAADPAHGAWSYVCTVGGTQPEPYGPVLDSSACGPEIYPFADVGTHAGCTSTAAGFSGVMDMPGSAHEWLDSCTTGAAADGSQTTCVMMAGADCTGHGDVARPNATAAIRCCYE